jgi:hypothetical protein
MDRKSNHPTLGAAILTGTGGAPREGQPIFQSKRAAALLSMAQSWDTLAEDTARYEAIVKAETE